jgi:hypothetical protein
MTKETLKEIGKLSFDIAKIVFAVAILAPSIGIILINKGTKNE